MNGRSAAWGIDVARALLYSGLLLAGGASGLVWSQNAYRERGTHGSYSTPVERPTLPMPGKKGAQRDLPAQDQQLAAASAQAGEQPPGDAASERSAAYADDQQSHQAARLHDTQTTTQLQPAAAVATSDASGQAAPPGPAVRKRAERMIGQTIVNPSGKSMGEVRAVVRSRRDQGLRAVVATGGLLGLGERNVVVPLDQLQLQADGRVMLMTEQRMAAYRPEDFDPVEPQQDTAPRGREPTAPSDGSEGSR
jgi:hypothetical protein